MADNKYNKTLTKLADGSYVETSHRCWFLKEVEKDGVKYRVSRDGTVYTRSKTGQLRRTGIIAQ